MAKETDREKDERLAREAEAEEQRLKDEQAARLREREEQDLADARAASGATTTETAEKKTIHVVSILPARPDGGHPVALFETLAEHPGGQAYVAGPVPVEVAPTAEVSRAIHEKRVREITASESKSISDKYNAERRARRSDALQAAREVREASEAAGG